MSKHNEHSANRALAATRKPVASKYDAARALNELYAAREAGNWASDTQLFGPRIVADPSYPGDTAMLPALKMPEGDDTVPMLPALLRPQAE